ncbi:hypothetical protein IW262DRAFT_1485126 [Armillaria fumosa]|nr:hypothetical protein IW262DRAFT_1485126 [Armillaria fumosa]
MRISGRERLAVLKRLRDYVELMSNVSLVKCNIHASSNFDNTHKQGDTTSHSSSRIDGSTRPRLEIFLGTHRSSSAPRHRESVWGCQRTVTADAVWQALGVGVWQVGNHVPPVRSKPDLNVFANKFLKDQDANTNIIKTDGAHDLGFVDSRWINWKVTALRLYDASNLPPTISPAGSAPPGKSAEKESTV